MRVAVLGAGPTGVMAAADLAAAGHDVAVLEAGPTVGGMAGSFEIAGQRVDYGSHRLHPAAHPDLLELIGRLLGDDLQERPRNGRIHLHDRWIRFPLRASDLLRRLPPRFAIGSAVDTLTRPLRSTPDDSFHGVIRAGLGPTVAQSFYGPYARKLYGVEPDELSSEVARRRVAASSPGAIVKRLTAAARGGQPTFLYPRNGYGAIVEALAEHATSQGATIMLNRPVDAITTTATGLAVDAGDSQVVAEHVISTIPLPSLVDAVPVATVPDIIQDAVTTLRVRGMILVYLVVPRTRYTEFDAHYLPSIEQRTGRLSEPKNYRDGPDPSDLTVLCAEIACWPDEDLWRWSDDELGALVSEELRSVGLPDPTAVHVETRRLPSVYPVYERRTQAARDALLDWSQSLPGLTVTGRQGHAVFDNLHHVMSMGRAAAQAITPHGHDASAWRRSVRSFDDHVVED